MFQVNFECLVCETIRKSENATSCRQSLKCDKCKQVTIHRPIIAKLTPKEKIVDPIDKRNFRYHPWEEEETKLVIDKNVVD